MDTSTLINANPALITNEDYIRAGDILTIPGCGRNPTPTPIGGGAVGTPTPFFGTPPGFGSGGATGTDGSATLDNTTGPIQYVVQAGDNVYQLSVRFGVTMRAIQNANPRLRDDINYLVVGEALTIPARTIFDTPTPTLSSAG
jgi:LysM repeat protein